MDTSTSLNLETISELKVRELFHSSRPEDVALAEKASGIIEAILQEINPIVHYLAFPVLITVEQPSKTAIKNWYGNKGGYSDRNDCDRLLPLEMPEGLLTDRLHQGRGELFLGCKRDVWTESFECNSEECIAANGKHYHGRISGACLWGDVPFRIIIERMNAALKEAQTRREKHLEAIRKRTTMLDEIEAVLRKH